MAFLMASKPLQETMKQNEFQIRLVQEHTGLTLFVNRAEGIVMLTPDGRAPVSYNSQLFLIQPEAYVREQLGAHRSYREWTKESLVGAYKDAKEHRDTLSRFEERLGELPDDARGTAIKFTKCALQLKALRKFTTLKKIIEEHMFFDKAHLNSYFIIKPFIDHGLKFVDERRAIAAGNLPNSTVADLQEWARIQGDLSSLYSNLITASQRRLDANKKLYDTFYPSV